MRDSLFNSTGGNDSVVEVIREAQAALRDDDSVRSEQLDDISKRLHELLEDPKVMEDGIINELTTAMLDDIDWLKVAQSSKDESVKMINETCRAVAKDYFKDVVPLPGRDLINITSGDVPDVKLQLVEKTVLENVEIRDLILAGGAVLGATVLGRLFYSVGGKVGAVGGGIIGAFLGSAGGSVIGDEFVSSKNFREEVVDEDGARCEMRDAMSNSVSAAITPLAEELRRQTSQLVASLERINGKKYSARPEEDFDHEKSTSGCGPLATTA